MATYYATITGGSGSGYYTQSSVFWISAYTPPAGKYFRYWGYGGGLQIAGSPSNATTTAALVTGNGWATVVYGTYSYTITYSAGTGGTISGTASQTKEYGSTSDSVTAVADSGYYFVQWNDGNTNASRTDGFYADATYTATFAVSNPSVTSVSPSSGNTVGGTSIAITGERFTGATSVTIGGVACTSVSVVSDTSITAVTPRGALGAEDVVVTTPTGSGTLTDGYTYTATSQTATGSVTPAGTILNRVLSLRKTGSVTPSGILSYVKTSAYAKEIQASVTPVGNLFIVKLQPKLLYAPHVSTTLRAE